MYADRLGAEEGPEGRLFCALFEPNPRFSEQEGSLLTGYIHSLESMGLGDGPGVRCVVFLQGCPLRCLYCHNPDTQTAKGGEAVEPEALVRRLLRFRPYFDRSGGGVTFSGGEPLFQPEFLAECLARLRKAGVHTCLDTSGAGLGAYEDILSCTDLLLYDVKHEAPEEYQRVTGRSMEWTLAFVEAVRRAGTPMWVRHVVVPGLTDQEEHLAALRRYVDDLPNVQKVELLPFHKLGAEKYRGLGRTDPLAEVPAMDPELCRQLQERWFSDLNG